MNENALLKTERLDFATDNDDQRRIFPDRWYAVRSYEILTLELWNPSPANPYELFVAWKDVAGAVKQLNWMEFRKIKIKISDYGSAHNRGSLLVGKDSTYYLENMEIGSIRVRMQVHNQWPEDLPADSTVTESSLEELPEDSNWDDMVDYSGA